jgi:alpha-D-ribose 1-methylphosphonate 5-triphosphate synthase subunit PhnG
MDNQQVEAFHITQTATEGIRAPRVTVDMVDALADGATRQYYRFSGTTLTVCCLELVNGYCVTGTSACVSRELYDKEVGERLAFDDAKRQIWHLEGYVLASREMWLKQAFQTPNTEPAAEMPLSEGQTTEDPCRE